MGESRGQIRLVNKSLLKYIFAVTIYGTISLLVKNIAVSTGEIAFWRVAIALTAILIYKFIKHEKLPRDVSRGDLIRLALSGIVMGFGWILFFQAMSYVSVSVATLCNYFCPVLVMVLSPIVFKEKLTMPRVICFVMATVGLVLIIGARSGGGDKQILGIVFALISAFGYAFNIIVTKNIKSVSGIDKTVFQFIAALIVLAIYVPFTTGFHAPELETKGIVCLLVLGLFNTAFTYCLYFTSITELPGQKVALFGYIDPLVAVFVSVVFLRESITAIQLIGGAMIIGFTILNEFWDFRISKKVELTEEIV